MGQALDQLLVSIARECHISVYEAALALSELRERHLDKNPGISFSLSEICRRIDEIMDSTLKQMCA